MYLFELYFCLGMCPGVGLMDHVSAVFKGPVTLLVLGKILFFGSFLPCPFPTLDKFNHIPFFVLLTFCFFLQIQAIPLSCEISNSSACVLNA